MLAHFLWMNFEVDENVALWIKEIASPVRQLDRPTDSMYIIFETEQS